MAEVTPGIVILGGGFAGLAAGVALAERGRRVTVLEQKPHLGGRARSFQDPSTGSVVDNGQHLFMGCYHATRKFFATIGTSDRVEFQPRLSVPFLDRDGRLTRLDCPDLPAPFHLLLGVLRSGSFTFKQKLEVLRLGAELRNSGGGKTSSHDDERVTAWLTRRGQSEGLQQNFWDLLCIAAMNEDPRIASAKVFERVIKLALLSSPEDSKLGIARVGLSDCYTAAATAYIEARGGQVMLSHSVKQLLIEDGICRGVDLGESKIEVTQIISAVPWQPFAAILPSDILHSDPFFGGALALKPAPIISINLWFDAPITDLEFVGLRGTNVQWLFDKSRILGASDHCIALVLSGAHEHISKSKEELLAIAMKELGKVLPAAKKARLLYSLVIKERFATFSPSPEAEPLRPKARTPIKGLYLAGDWTATGLPATIEGAVQSGYSAAHELTAGN